MIKIPNFSKYLFDEKTETIINTKTSNLVTISSTERNPHKFCKLQDDYGDWIKISLSKVRSLCYPPTTPKGYYKALGVSSNTYVSKDGKAWGTSIKNPNGIFYTSSLDTSGYPIITLPGRVCMNIHKLMALTFIDSQYLEKGLCVMHLDNDKTNNTLPNLKVATYSENNKAAYDDGLNPGNGLKK